MENFTSYSNEDLCNFLLNGKKADALQIDPERGPEETASSTDRTIYKDKNVEIIFSYLKTTENEVIQQFFIYSKWWGRIKNSFFTLEGKKINATEIKCGVINVEELRPWNFGGGAVQINNKNEVVNIEVTDFTSLVRWCQRMYKKSPSYFVSKVISLPPNPLVEITITMPDGEKHFSEGKNQKEAANKFSIKYFKKNQ